MILNDFLQCFFIFFLLRGVNQKDCWKLKELFGRGQAFNDKKSICEVDYENILSAGISKVEKFEILINEYYKTEDDLMALLLKAPILDDFSELKDSSKNYLKSIDSNLFKEHVKRFKAEKGIMLERVFYGIVVENNLYRIRNL